MPNKNSKAQHKPQRTCVVCKTTNDADSLLSFILISEGLIFESRRLIQQRKQYVCFNPECLTGLDKWKKVHLKKRFGITGTADVFTQNKPKALLVEKNETNCGKHREDN